MAETSETANVALPVEASTNLEVEASPALSQLSDDDQLRAAAAAPRKESIYHDAIEATSTSPSIPATVHEDAEEPTSPLPHVADHTAEMGVFTHSPSIRQSLNNPAAELQEMLRAQITDLSSQVTSLNAKLVSTFGRIGDLEDELHQSETSRSSLQKRVERLDTERKNWEDRVEGGLLVEKVCSLARAPIHS